MKRKENKRGDPITLNPNLKKCNICGKMYDPDEFRKKISFINMMRERSLCFRCAFWVSKIESPDQNAEIINGHYYTCNSDPLDFMRDEEVMESRCYNKKKESLFYIMRDDKSVKALSNMILQGIVPQRFKHQLKDTGRQITKWLYVRLRNNNFTCRSKGCWDRYHCFRYNMEVEKDGPWNIIPKSHKIGDEECKMFINKKFTL